MIETTESWSQGRNEDKLWSGASRTPTSPTQTGPTYAARTRSGSPQPPPIPLLSNTCQVCYQTSCVHREGVAGAQPELLRVPLADGTLVATPDVPADDLVPSFLTAADVLGTGWFGAVAAEAGPGKTVPVVGDGAVGLLGVLAAQQVGAERIIAMSRHEPRQRPACEYGATDIVEERGDAGVAKVKELTDGLGADSVIEAVGTHESILQAIRATRRARRPCRCNPRRSAR